MKAIMNMYACGKLCLTGNITRERVNGKHTAGLRADVEQVEAEDVGAEASQLGLITKHPHTT